MNVYDRAYASSSSFTVSEGHAVERMNERNRMNLLIKVALLFRLFKGIPS